jgi:hypothetical protein
MADPSNDLEAYLKEHLRKQATAEELGRVIRELPQLV